MPNKIARSLCLSAAAILASAGTLLAQDVTRAYTDYSLTAGSEIKVYLTGYSYWDNTPRGSTAIAKPVVHRRAGGHGTYNDPVTLAVGYRLNGRRVDMDYPAGTRFYLPKLRKYAIVEDVCGDGNAPHVTGCARGHRGHPWIDIWVDGRNSGTGASNSCMHKITGIQTALINPSRGLPVVKGPVTEGGCHIF